MLRAIRGGFRPPKLTPDQGTIKALRDLLTLAESGELREIAWVCRRESEGMIYGWRATGSALQMLGAVTVLAHDMAAMVGGEDEDG